MPYQQGCFQSGTLSSTLRFSHHPRMLQGLHIGCEKAPVDLPSALLLSPGTPGCSKVWGGAVAQAPEKPRRPSLGPANHLNGVGGAGGCMMGEAEDGGP